MKASVRLLTLFPAFIVVPAHADDRAMDAATVKAVGNPL
jgi:hypothetical protein